MRASAAVTPPLRFDGAVVDGSLPAAPGSVRLLSQTLSAAAAGEYYATTQRWRAETRADGRTPQLKLLSALPGDCVADASVVLKSARTFLKIPNGKARRASRAGGRRAERQRGKGEARADEGLLHGRAPPTRLLRRTRRCMPRWRRSTSRTTTSAPRCAAR